MKNFKNYILIVFAVIGLSAICNAQFTQVGAKLEGTGPVGFAQQGFAVAISADGNTAIEGGNLDNSQAGAVWIFTKTGGVWTQQGSKLVGTGATGAAEQGTTVALSSDGNTAIVGGVNDNSHAGAAWIFVRSGGVWTQQGTKLVGTGAVNGTGGAQQGYSVSLSADGNTAIIGAAPDNGGIGAAWVFTRTSGVWTQQGSKLVGTGNIGGSGQGYSISISADGNTAALGGRGDNYAVGATWIFTRSGGVWTQQGTKLVGTGVVGGVSGQGAGVSLSADGNTLIVGGDADNSSDGAAWVFTRHSGVWTQEGTKLVGTGGSNPSEQGCSVSLSSDGNTAISGAYYDNGGAGAAWIFTRSGGVWTQQGGKLVGTGGDVNTFQGLSVSISSNGNAIVGGPFDGGSVGGFWLYSSTSCSPYFYLYPDTSILHHYHAVNMANGVSPLRYYWNWGDGNHDTIAYPSHTYASTGLYTICLTITDFTGCVSTYCDTSFNVVKVSNTMTMAYVNVIPAGIDEINASKTTFSVYPNPASNNLTIDVSASLNIPSIIEIFNLEGQLIETLATIGNKTNVDISTLSKGMYFIKIKAENGVAVKKFIKE